MRPTQTLEKQRRVILEQAVKLYIDYCFPHHYNPYLYRIIYEWTNQKAEESYNGLINLAEEIQTQILRNNQCQKNVRQGTGLPKY